MRTIEDVAFQVPAYHSSRQLTSVRARASDVTASYPPAEMFELIEQLSVHGLVEEFEAFTLTHKAQIARSQALGRYVAQHRRFLVSCQKALSDDFPARLRTDLLSEVPQLVTRGGARRLLIVAPTYYNNVMMSLPVLDRFLARLDVDVLYLKATHSAIPYYTGLFGLGGNRQRVVKTLAEFVAARGYERVDVLGASSGGFLALWLGAELGAAKVCVYGGDITPTMRSKHLSREDIARSMTEDPVGDLCDLSKIDTIYAYSGNLRSRDVECLTYLEQYPNVRPHLEMAADHLVLLNLVIRGYAFEELVA